jgi:ABC-type lipoprotein export system ATPase subunit
MTQAMPYASAPATRPEGAILRAKGINKSFRMGDSTVVVLKSADISIREGEFVAIEGRSGSGKSTLLHILGGLDSIDAGNVDFEGIDYTSRKPTGFILTLRRVSRWVGSLALTCFVAVPLLFMAGLIVWSIFRAPWMEEYRPTFGLTIRWIATGFWVFFILWIAILSVRAIIHHIREAPLARRRNRDFGFVFQFYFLLPELNVLENTLLAPMIGGDHRGVTSRGKRIERATEILKQLGMDHRLKHRPSQLSGGERQRVAIARALMNRPKVVFADEPTGNLDAETGKQIMAVLETLHREQGQTIVMVTHDRTLAKKADRVLVLKDGKLERPQE